MKSARTSRISFGSAPLDLYSSPLDLILVFTERLIYQFKDSITIIGKNKICNTKALKGRCINISENRNFWKNVLLELIGRNRIFPWSSRRPLHHLIVTLNIIFSPDWHPQILVHQQSRFGTFQFWPRFNAKLKCGSILREDNSPKLCYHMRWDVIQLIKEFLGRVLALGAASRCVLILTQKMG